MLPSTRGTLGPCPQLPSAWGTPARAQSSQLPSAWVTLNHAHILWLPSTWGTPCPQPTAMFVFIITVITTMLEGCFPNISNQGRVHHHFPASLPLSACLLNKLSIVIPAGPD